MTTTYANTQEGVVPIQRWSNWYREQRTEAETRRVGVFVRSLAPTPGGHSDRHRRLDHLDRMVTTDRIDAFDVVVLGEQICTCARCQRSAPDGSLFETVTELREWEFGQLRPTGFRTRSISSSLTGEQYCTVVPPEFSLGIYLDDDLVGVFPCGTENRSCDPDTYFDIIGGSRAEG